jgi:hypothetical protein
MYICDMIRQKQTLICCFLFQLRFDLFHDHFRWPSYMYVITDTWRHCFSGYCPFQKNGISEAVMRGDTWGSVYMDSNFSSALYNRHAPPFNWPIHLYMNIHLIAFGGFLNYMYSRIYRAVIPAFVLKWYPRQFSFWSPP